MSAILVTDTQTDRQTDRQTQSKKPRHAKQWQGLIKAVILGPI